MLVNTGPGSTMLVNTGPGSNMLVNTGPGSNMLVNTGPDDILDIYGLAYANCLVQINSVQ